MKLKAEARAQGGCRTSEKKIYLTPTGCGNGAVLPWLNIGPLDTVLCCSVQHACINISKLGINLVIHYFQ
jgi:hypothetical protein